MNRLLTTLLCLALAVSAFAAPAKKYDLLSPDGKNLVSVSVGSDIRYSVSHAGQAILVDDPVSMTFADGTVFGRDDKVRKALRSSVSSVKTPVLYRQSQIKEQYNELKLSFKEFDLVFRAYDQGVAYRFISRLKGERKVKAEQVELRFASDWEAVFSYARFPEQEDRYIQSFENTCDTQLLSAWKKDSLAFLPLLVKADDLRVLVTEADLWSYPGLFLAGKGGDAVLRGDFAPYPVDVQGNFGGRGLQERVGGRADYIAVSGDNAQYPWRIVSVAEKDIDLLTNNLVWLLARPDDGRDWSWVKPGKVAWDWWNDWNIGGVDFKAGINTATYKYYIDFASAYGIEYVIMDEGWAVPGAVDLLQIIPEIDLPEIIRYAGSKNVGIILWAGFGALKKDIPGLCRHFADMGVKGFKVDFMNRDDQPMVEFYENVAREAAACGLMVDFHGAYKPTGLQRTWPNVVNFEGVHGLEQLKWEDFSDQVTYDTQIPFIRQVAGPLDYTQGAMRNATRGNFRPVNSEPMSQGTRCRQLALYMIFESPLNMLCDTPTQYMKEAECTRFIADVPTVWDETVPICGKVGEYVAIARRKGSVWYIGAITNWTARDLELDLGAGLGGGTWKCESFSDGANASRLASDYRHSTATVSLSEPLKVHLAPGGGWAAVLSR